MPLNGAADYYCLLPQADTPILPYWPAATHRHYQYFSSHAFSSPHQSSPSLVTDHHFHITIATITRPLPEPIMILMMARLAIKADASFADGHLYFFTYCIIHYFSSHTYLLLRLCHYFLSTFSFHMPLLLSLIDTLRLDIFFAILLLFSHYYCHFTKLFSSHTH